MTIYYALIAAMLLLSFFHKDREIVCEEKNIYSHSLFKYRNEGLFLVRKNIIIFLSFFLFLFIAGFRGENVGKDISQYKLIFELRNNYGILDSITGVEPLFMAMTQLIGKITDNFQIMLFIYSFIAIIGPLYLINKYSSNVYYSLFLYIAMGFQATSFSGLRTAMAMSILCFAYEKAKNRELLKFLLMVIIACLFHRTALAFLIVYPLIPMKLTIKKVGLVGIGALIIYLFGKRIFSLITTISMFRKYSQFIRNTGSISFALVILIIFIILMVYYNNVKNKYGNVDHWYLMLLVAFLVQLAGLYNTNIMRLTYYFYVPVLFIIPNTFDAIIDNRNRKLVYCLFSIIMIAQYLVAFASGYGAENYQFFWSDIR